ncbi:hypothetical protein OB13_12925 [Pontibacter sp. HJ8]
MTLSLFFAGIGRAIAQDDITARGGALTVFRENDGGADANEGSPKVIDNDAQTKFLSHFPGSQWLQLRLDAPAAVGSYTLVSANDDDNRDPMNWTLEGSDNGTDWTVLDTQTGQMFSERFQKKTYPISNTTAYAYYRLNISAIKAGNTFQLGEWRLYEVVQAPDITARGGTLTVFRENDGGADANEGSPKVIDNDAQTKFLSHFPGSQWLQLKLDASAVVVIYTLTSANDDPNRDPKDWTLEGSKNGTDWTTLDTRTGEMFSERFQTKTYNIENATAYTYYRLNISAIKDGSTFQLGEWRLYQGAAPSAPSNLDAFATAGDEVSLTWTDNAGTETGFELERSTDGTTFAKIADLGADVVSYYDKGLSQATHYYYKIRAVGAFGPSAYSSVKEVTTLDFSGAFVDITDNGGEFKVSNENTGNAGENSSKFIDNDFNTKFLIPSRTLWTQYKSTSTADLVTKYSIVSGNDAPDRDPKDWTFEGSNDGETWTVLDTRKSQYFPSRNAERVFAFKNSQSFQYYRLNISLNSGSDAIQMSEWLIWGIPQDAPAVPANLTIADVTESEISLTWEDIATNETAYEVWRSTDGTTFALLKSVDAGTTSYTDTKLKVLTSYYYRVRAVGASSNSIYSATATATTLYDERLPLPAEDLMATALSETEVQLSWTDRSENETAYTIERSKDGTTFTVIGTIAADANAYTDQALKLATKYYYRVRPLNEFSQSSGQEVPYTQVVEVITPGTNQAPAFAAIADQSSCNVQDAYTIPLVGLIAGPEPGQQLTLSVTSNRSAMFSDLSVSRNQAGEAVLSYKLAQGQPGEATVTVTAQDDGGTLNGGADTFSRTFKITAYELNVSIASDHDGKIARGETVKLTATGDGNYRYTWADGPGILSGQNTNELIVKPTQGYVYKVTASTEEGCTNEAEFTIQMEGGVRLQANNILTPNGDGKNDVWVIWNINTFPGSKLKVFDTAGRIVYEAENYANNWTGTSHGSPLAAGVYYYIIDLGSGIPSAKGSLTIIRD